MAVQQLSGVVQQTGGNWWDGSSSFGSPDPVYLTGTFAGASSGTWSYTLPPAFQNALVSGASYYIVLALDGCRGQYGIPAFPASPVILPAGVGVVVTYNVVPPTATISIPLNNLAGITGLSVISGTTTGKVPIKARWRSRHSKTIRTTTLWMNTSAFNYNFNVSQSTPNFIPGDARSSPNATRSGPSMPGGNLLQQDGHGQPNTRSSLRRPTPRASFNRRSF